MGWKYHLFTCVEKMPTTFFWQSTLLSVLRPLWNAKTGRYLVFALPLFSWHCNFLIPLEIRTLWLSVPVLVIQNRGVQTQGAWVDIMLVVTSLNLGFSFHKLGMFSFFNSVGVSSSIRWVTKSFSCCLFYQINFFWWEWWNSGTGCPEKL